MTDDSRTCLARPDLAAGDLEGRFRAKRYASAVAMRLNAPSTPILAAADPMATRLDQLIFGEIFDVVEVSGDFAWGQARRGGYVGFAAIGELTRQLHSPSHRVSALRSFAFAEASIKSTPWGPVSLNALLSITDETDTLALAQDAGWIAKAHISLIGTCALDWVAVAERFLGAPYLWGGRDSLGLDCSGLVQQALFAAGRACPRDSDQQQALGWAVEGPAARGDLVFWPGHVGIALDAGRLLHANAHHMAVAVEPLDDAISRIQRKGGGGIIAHRRL